MAKWEYCVLVGVSTSRDYTELHTHYPKLIRVTENGTELVTNFKDRPKNITESKSVAQMLFQLGEDGWELVFGQNFGEGGITQHDDTSMWFKRPKS
jgi:hypothetical protein